ncbi:hypothetical protein RMN57_35955 [Kitasatospora sp. CM 4170]|uniref:DUF3558 domain-containing protein n=1 Tax=Kitasatospora aburaviensis TaxID=67265 RepID=A0ABW1EZB1_9ACTN|nr:hypothetical protein [Kitasatospora sp. CM 4170]WNM49715.1 hypothetical protein RMN57_35955 [Kitasatospora sp. CM 4170]
MTDIQPDASLETTETISGSEGGRGRRLWLFGGAAAVVAAVVVGAVLVLGGSDDEAGPKQTLCGLERAAGTPLATVLPKGRPGTEHREVRGDKHIYCTIEIDGETAVSVSVFGVDPEEPEEPGHASAKDLIGRGVVAGGPGASVFDYCSGDHSKGVAVAVSADTSILPRKTADVEPVTKALGKLTEKVLADQQGEVCR